MSTLRRIVTTMRRVATSLRQRLIRASLFEDRRPRIASRQRLTVTTTLLVATMMPLIAIIPRRGLTNDT